MRGRTLDDAFVILDERKYDHADEDVFDLGFNSKDDCQWRYQPILTCSNVRGLVLIDAQEEHSPDWLCSFSAKDVVHTTAPGIRLMNQYQLKMKKN